MTAVPATRNKTKDPFQLELDKEIAKRRSRGLKTGFSDEESNNDEKLESKDDDYSDDYEDDFQSDDGISESDSDDDFLREYLKPSTSVEKNSTTAGLQNENDLGTTLSLTKRGSSFPIFPKRSSEFSKATNKNITSNMDDDPLAALLKEESSKNANQPEMGSVVSGSSLSKEGSLKKKVTFQPPTSSLSPRYEPRSPTALQKTSPERSNSTENEDLSPNVQSSQTALKASNESHSMLDELLADSKPLPVRRKAGVTSEAPAKPQPKTRRRHDSNRSSISEDSQTRAPTRTSEMLQQLKEEDKDKGDIGKSSPRQESKYTFPSLSKPRLQPQIEDKEDEMRKLEKERHPAVDQPLKMSEANKKAHQIDSDMSSSTEDLLAKLAAHDDVQSPKKTHSTSSFSEKQTSLTDVSRADVTTEKDSASETPHEISQASTLASTDPDALQYTYVIDKKQTDDDDTVTELKFKRTSSRPGSARKSPRTPPVNYRGLGSLDGLQQLRTLKGNDSVNLNSSANVRSTVYMQWLADREKKLQVKKKEKIEAEEKENEKKKKDFEEKISEGESARKAWLQRKEEILKEQEQQKRREERRIRSEKMREEEEKRKSASKADVVRQKALKEAKRRHREEMRKKKEEERIAREKEEEKKKKNEEELNKWTEKRAKQWEIDRKKEIREKKAKEREVKKAKEKKEKEAEDLYSNWREKKSEQEKSKRVNHHDQARPPWSPANKVIPRAR